MTDHIIEAAREAGQYADAEYRRAWEEASDGASWQQNRDARFYAIAYRQGMERAAEIADESLTWSLRGDKISDRILAEAHAQNQPKNVDDGSVV